MTYPETQTFWLEPSGLAEVGLRRYVRDHSGGWTCEEGWHAALVITGVEQAVVDPDGIMRSPRRETDHSDPNWPMHCEQGCGYTFTDNDYWQDWTERQYVRSDTAQPTTLRRVEPGACWDAFWMPADFHGQDGVALMVKCPNGRDWAVDSQASNCTRKGEPHACWVRHGDPRECKVTVDKNGDTCAAGAGSILAGDYHGFLRDGVLTAG